MITLIGMTNAFILGLLASLSPCLFPVLPTFIAFLTNSETKQKQGIFAAFLVTSGIMTVFVILAIFYNQLIHYLSPNYLLFRTWQGIILILLGVLLTLGFSLNLNILDKLNTIADSMIQKFSNPWIVSYLIGLTFTLLAAPCAFIVFATAFTLAFSYSFIGTTIFMIIFSIGAGLPFFLVGGYFPKAKDMLLEKRHSVQKYISIIAGVMIISIGIYLTLDGQKLL